MMYLERPGCNLCMGNQEKAEKGDTVMATSTRLFQGRVVADSDEKKESPCWHPHQSWSFRRFWVEHRIWMSISPQ